MKTAWTRVVGRKLVTALCALAGIWAAGCVLIYFEMRKPPEEFGRFMMKIPTRVVFMGFPFETLWMRAREGGLHVGDAARDFTLHKIGESESVRLSELDRQQPVVLVFGSYT